MSTSLPVYRLAVLDRLWNWYWDHGRERQGQFELRASGWVDQLNRLLSLRDSIDAALRQGKPAMAVWGPSQTGKSTLISSDVDAGAGPLGENSALHWPGGVPARFVAKAPALAEAIVLNPFAFGSDASGCVTRFRLASSIPDPMYPVELRVSAPEQLQHAIALGYLSECRTDGVTGLTVKFDEDRFTRLLDQWTERNPSPGPPNREAFEKLCRLVDLVELLVLSGEGRYENLRPCQAAIRRLVLEHRVLTSDPRHVDAFAAEVLWDNQSSLNELFHNLIQKASSLRSRWANKPVRCSLQAAALLLDIDSFQKLGNTSVDNRRVRDLVSRFSYSIEETHVRVGFDLPNKLVERDEDFGAIQGLVLELVVPLREQRLREVASDFCAFLEAADLLDFPGVALAHSHTEHTRLDLRALQPGQKAKLYTEVLKRGKTASIVASYARNMTIDGFSVLTRIQRFPAQPGQLLSGITTWWRCFDPGYRSRDLLQRSPLPLNLILTFCAELVGPVVQSGVRDGLDPVFKRLRQLGPLAEPSVLTNTLATNYPQFHDGKLPDEPEQLRRAVAEIMNDPAFQKQFQTNAGKESFRKAIEDGGTNFVFKVLRDQASGSRRTQLLEDRRLSLDGKLRELIDDAYPSSADAGERRREMLGSWWENLRTAVRDMIQDSTTDDPVAAASQTLRALFSVDFQSLDPIPANLARLPVARVADFIVRQLERWVASACATRLATPAYLSRIGVRDATHLAKLLHYIAATLDTVSLARWTILNMGTLTSQEDLRLYRRYLAIALSNALLNAGLSSIQSGVHPGESEVRAAIDNLASLEDGSLSEPERSPHYQRVVEPILQMIRRVAESPLRGERPPQPGDTQLLALLRETELTTPAMVQP